MTPKSNDKPPDKIQKSRRHKHNGEGHAKRETGRVWLIHFPTLSNVNLLTTVVPPHPLPCPGLFQSLYNFGQTFFFPLSMRSGDLFTLNLNL